MKGIIFRCGDPCGSLERSSFAFMFFAVFLCLSAVQHAVAADAADIAGRETPSDVHVGDTYAQVVATKGQPSSQIAMGAVRTLSYPDENIRLREDVVVKVELAPKQSPMVAAPRAPEPPQAAVTQGDYGPPHQVQLVCDDIQNRIGAFSRATRGKFKGGEFADLEKGAARFIADKSRFGDGLWRIVALHEALELPSDAKEEVWTAREADIAKWETQFPLSITARIVHIQFLISYAWHARGSGYADNVRDEAWPIFGNRLARAYILYQSAQKFEQKSPMLWFAGQKIAMGQGWPVEEVSKDFEAAKGIEPEFLPYDYAYAYYLMPRWHGKDGDWEAFAAAEMKRENGLGAEGYARLIFAMHGYYKNIFKESRARWVPVKEGYSLMFKKYPAAKSLLNQYAALAVQADDRIAAHEAFEAMKGQGDPSIWSADGVARYQAWAYRSP
jgi:hypothetical protein